MISEPRRPDPLRLTIAFLLAMLTVLLMIVASGCGRQPTVVMPGPHLVLVGEALLGTKAENASDSIITGEVRNDGLATAHNAVMTLIVKDAATGKPIKYASYRHEVRLGSVAAGASLPFEALLVGVPWGANITVSAEFEWEESH